MYWQSSFAAQDRKLAVFPGPKTLSSKFTGPADALHALVADQGLGLDYIAILSGDQVYRMDYRELISFHRAHAGAWTAAAVPTGKGPGLQERMGAYVFSPRYLQEGLERALSQGNRDLTRVILPELTGNDGGAEFVFTGPDGRPAFWRPLKDLASYWRTHMDILDGRIPELTKDPAPGLTRPPASRLNLIQNYVSGPKRIINSMVASTAEIGGATVENSMIGPGVRVEDRAIVRRAVVLDGAVIRKGMTIGDALVEPGAEIKPRLISAGAARDLPAAFPGLHLMAPAGPSPGPQPGPHPARAKHHQPE
jgi:glucose-1-phosphate adenylyltransferase